MPPRPGLLGPLGPPQLACLRSWLRLGLAPVFIHVAEDGAGLPFLRSLLGGYLRVEPGEILTPPGTRRLAAFLAEAGCEGLACVSYGPMEWLWENRALWPPGMALWLPRPPVIAFLKSKIDQIALAEAVGLPVLPTLHLAAADQLVRWRHWPAVARPGVEGTVHPPFKAELLRHRVDAEALLARLAGIDQPLLMQPLRRGPNLVVHGFRSVAGVVRQQGFTASRKFEGVTLTLTPADPSPGLERACAAFVERAGLIGIYHFEFLLDEHGRPWFLEINGRFGGTTGKALACGHDEPALLLHAHGVLAEPAAAIRPKAVASNRLALVKYLLRAAGAGLGPLDHPSAGGLRAAIDVLPGLLLWRDEITGGDWRGALAYLGQRLRLPMGRGKPSWWRHAKP